MIGQAESMPFADASFDRVTCRQGIQFMDAPKAAAEVLRVLKLGGMVILIDLAAYGEDDRDEYFEVLRLRNPARRNFWVRGDVQALLEDAGFSSVRTVEHVSIEDVDAWSANGAISESGVKAFETSTATHPPFRSLHAVATGTTRASPTTCSSRSRSVSDSHP